jgi:hypothetical protein
VDAHPNGQKEDLDLPAFTIDSRERRGTQGQVIRQKHDLITGGVTHHDSIQEIGAALVPVLRGEANHFIRDDLPAFGRGQRLHHGVFGVVFEVRDEEDALFGPGVKERVVAIATVHHQNNRCISPTSAVSRGKRILGTLQTIFSRFFTLHLVHFQVSWQGDFQVLQEDRLVFCRLGHTTAAQFRAGFGRQYHVHGANLGDLIEDFSGIVSQPCSLA